jgi:hypothetical protein
VTQDEVNGRISHLRAKHARLANRLHAIAVRGAESAAGWRQASERERATPQTRSAR